MDNSERNSDLPPPRRPSDVPPPSTPAGASGTPPPVPPPADPYGTPPPAGTAAKADLGKRIIAALIDGVLAAVLAMLPFIGWILAAAYMTVRDGLELDFMDRRSLGKKLMKLRPVRVDGGAMDIETSVRRNWMLVIGYLASIPFLGWFLIPVAFIGFIIIVVEFVLVMTDPTGRRWGDKFANTHVIEVAD